MKSLVEALLSISTEMPRLTKLAQIDAQTNSLLIKKIHEFTNGEGTIGNVLIALKDRTLIHSYASALQNAKSDSVDLLILRDYSFAHDDVDLFKLVYICLKSIEIRENLAHEICGTNAANAGPQIREWINNYIDERYKIYYGLTRLESDH